MGPVSYLAQSHGALRPISAMPLKNWPRLFVSAPLGQKKPLRSPPKKIRLRRAKKCHALPGMPVGLLPGRQLEARWKRERRDANGFAEHSFCRETQPAKRRLLLSSPAAHVRHEHEEKKEHKERTRSSTRSEKHGEQHEKQHEHKHEHEHGNHEHKHKWLLFLCLFPARALNPGFL